MATDLSEKIVKNVIFNPALQLITYLAIIGLISHNGHGIPHHTTLLFWFFSYLSLILNVSCNPRSFFKYDNHLFNYLGKISYGIY